MEKNCNWKRFWCPREENYAISEDGYLLDPEEEFGSILNPNVVPLEATADIPCLILLGEPGIGKSKELQQISRVPTDSDHVLQIFDLKEYSAESLSQEIFDQNADFQNWLSGSHRLYLFLDSLDEGSLVIPNLSAILARRLRKYPADRLYLRIACRTAEWPKILEDNLRDVWETKNVNAYELVPLRRIDVRNAAVTNKLDAEAFLSTIAERGVAPLASKPITLRFLLREYQKKQALPDTRNELYENGCRFLCEEASNNRRAMGEIGNLSLDERMDIASRIAVLSIFCNRPSIWLGLENDASGTDLLIREVIDDDIKQEAVKETLLTGLFSSQPRSEQIGWRHQTYAEFLAARFLRQKLSIPQIISLLFYPDGKLVPQLQETAAWLASMMPEIFQAIISTEPAVLVLSDVANAEVGERERLVGTLLQQISEGNVRDFNFTRYDFKKLNYPNIADTLRFYVNDSTKNLSARRAAIRIAEACDIKALLEDILNVAINPSEPFGLREYAVDAIERIGDNEAKVKLRPIMAEESSGDSLDDLKGATLVALASANIGTQELFQLLFPYGGKHIVGGSYWNFLYDFGKTLPVEDLPTALDWAEKEASQNTSHSPLTRLVDDIILRSWENLDAPGIIDALARTIFALLRNSHRDIISRYPAEYQNIFIADSDKRRQLVSHLIPLFAQAKENKNAILALHWCQPRLIISEDVFWLLEYLRSSKPEEQEVLIRLICFVFDSNNLAQIDAIFQASKSYPLLRAEMAGFFDPINLDSGKAKELKEEHYRRESLRQQNEEQETSNPPSAQRIEKLLEICESGNLAAWYELVYVMQFGPDFEKYYHNWNLDITKLPGWEKSDLATRSRIIKIANSFIFEQDPKIDDYIGTNEIPYIAIDGYKALILLLKESPELFNAIPAEIWKKWILAILNAPVFNEDEKKLEKRLLDKAFSIVEDEFINALKTLIHKEKNVQEGHLFVLSKVLPFWNERIKDVLLTELLEGELKCGAFLLLLDALIKHDVKEAISYAESLLSIPLSPDEEARGRSVIAALALMQNTEAAGWQVIYEAMCDKDFARRFILALGHRIGYETGFIERLDEAQLAALYTITIREFPKNDSLSESFDIIRLRNTLDRALISAASPAACDAFRKMMADLPNESWWLKWSLLEVENLVRRKAWTPPMPSDILELAEDNQRKFVQSGEQLLDVIIESLGRLEKKLQHAETPAAKYLWNSQREKSWPKSEDDLSDYVKIHLDDDVIKRGLIVNREVEIKRISNKGLGERTDIHVDTISHIDSRHRIIAIIETKGCWNPKIKTDMKKQLVDRYMKETDCKYGLYLVGWYKCEAWSDEKKKEQVKFTNIEEVHAYFTEQAQELSKDGLDVRAFVIDVTLQ